jgi:hypothetical protein
LVSVKIEFQRFDRPEDAQAFCEKKALDVERGYHGDAGPPEALGLRLGQGREEWGIGSRNSWTPAISD